MSIFNKAERKKAKLRLALCGTSGSGKTYSSLEIATGLGGKIAFLDTERGSGELYADRFNFDVVQLNEKFTPDNYVNIIKSAEKEGYNVLIIDSLSHAWEGDGGVLEMHDAAARKSTNSFMAWRDITPQHNKLVDAILGANMHIIATMRSKTAYEIEQVEHNGKKKSTPKKVGLKPIQRDGMEYEFTCVLDMEVQSNLATASKDRTSLFADKVFKPSKETGELLREWLESGKELPQPLTKDEILTQLATIAMKNPDIVTAKFDDGDTLIKKIESFILTGGSVTEKTLQQATERPQAFCKKFQEYMDSTKE